MNEGKYVFSQIMELISYKKFQPLVNRHSGEYKVKDFSCWKQLLCMAFGQLTHRESLSDTVMCLKANAGKMYHLGIGEVVAKSTLTKANENRSYRIYQELAMSLIKEAKQLYLTDDDLEISLKGNVFAIDATTIDLCLSTFYWATFRSTKGGIKLHTQIDLKTSIPEFILFSTASLHDVNVLDVIPFEANSFYIMDRGYVDYKRLYKIHLCGAFFVTRAKDNMNYRRLYSRPKDKCTSVIYDQIIMVNNYYASKDYPERMRRIKFKDSVTGKILVFLTNNLNLTANEIAQLYKHRWKIELFFKCLPADEGRDKATFENKILQGAFRKCSKNPSMDCSGCLCFSGYRKKEIYAKTKPLRNSTNYKHFYFRKNALKTTLSGNPITIFQRTIS